MVVQEIKQRIGARMHRAQSRQRRGFSGAQYQPEAPSWLRSAVRLLPEHTRALLRDALDEGSLRAAWQSIQGEKRTLRERTESLDRARAELGQAQQKVEAERAELRAERRAADRVLAEAKRLVESASAVRRLPLSAIEFDPQDSPRPIREVARLAANIKRFGQQTPIVVTDDGGKYRLITGYRRMLALAEARCPHVDVRIVADISPSGAAALYIAENCLPTGMSPSAVERLAELAKGRPGFMEVIPAVIADDDAVVEEMFLDDMAADARNSLGEAARWIDALRPMWDDLADGDRSALTSLVQWFAQISTHL